MGLHIKGIRPALFSASNVLILRELLSFRHFFRHAYAAELDVQRLRRLRDSFCAATPDIIADLRALDTFLAEVAAEQ